MTSQPHPLVAICMATYEPSRTGLVRQLESIRAQSMRSWHCWVFDDGSSAQARDLLIEALGDDPRFSVLFFPDNVGFYRNFERGLRHLRDTSVWIALADQDDIWAPHKLERMVAHTQSRPTPRLVYCDMEIRTENGTLLSPTYWQGRSHNETDLAALAFANSVSGAAALFANDLLHVALPFPNSYSTSFHDHWLALVARVTGRIGYVDEPLQTYVQHSANAIGHQPGRVSSRFHFMKPLVTSAWWRRPEERYFDQEVARLSEMAETLLRRVDANPADTKVLRNLASLHGATPALMWLVNQAIRELRDPSVTMSRRQRVLASVLWTQLSRLRLN